MLKNDKKLHIVELPYPLPAPAELAEINHRLLAGEILLDWSAITSPLQPQQLLPLLQHFDLATHIDYLGDSTMTEATVQSVVEAIEMLEKPANGTNIIEKAPVSPTVAATDQPQSAQPEVPVDQPVKSPQNEAILRSQIPSPAHLRAQLEEMIVHDLLGPVAGEDEEVYDFRVQDRYLLGNLAPQHGSTIPAEEQEGPDLDEEAEEQGLQDSDSLQTTSLSPSSIGLSFSVDLTTPALLITARWGHYQKRISSLGEKKLCWKRSPRGSTWTLPLIPDGSQDWRPEPEEQPDVYVRAVTRLSATCWTVTLFLVNGQEMPEKNRDTAYLFQPELIVEAPNGQPVFQQRPGATQHRYKAEDKALAMLYRRHVSFAIGHGVGVHARTLQGDPTCAIRLQTRIVPRYEVPRTEAPTIEELPALADFCLDMRELAFTPQSQLASKLFPLINAYADWIVGLQQRLHDPNEHLQPYQIEARQAIEHCQQTLERIQAGIDLLATNTSAARAFTFMNQAMWQQRLHTLYSEDQRKQGSQTLETLDQPVNRSWRPFQLAFILLNLPALTDLDHPERSDDTSALADLLWFPTGGGKTEAYLGLTAYTLAIRRLQGVVAGRSGLDGVAVIMRYTLRLLTLQQFQRAAALMCACETIRRSDSKTWGTTPFRLGLWVGQHSTPNKTDASLQAINQARGNKNDSYTSSSPHQLPHCPWCGSLIAPGANIEVETLAKGRGRTLIYCSDAFGRCAFSKAQAPGEGLPVVVVDEEIYRLLPALLIATVDKFAQLPWQGETQMLFGQVDKYCERHGFRSPDLKDEDSHKALAGHRAVRSRSQSPLRPPDLIIQDELHLISGPLGTMVGLYETAVDHLATWQYNGHAVRPKVIAATATIRQAEQQVKHLFCRTLNIFPPSGLDVSDNFFSRQRPTSLEQPGRLYLGICANGRRMKAAQIRVYLAMLAAAQVLSNRYGSAAADPWMTLVGYFNSMSELGSMRHLVDDDIRNRIWKMDRRGLATRRLSKVEELTSRMSSSDIPKILSNLEQSFGLGSEPRPIDILLATNMISVGVDVKRLGLMAVVGQPKTTAEYIQATSRVGRSSPGLICVIYKWSRPRDLSHYEQFEHYHATFYQQVEALSVTPFAPRALDRGLAALLTSIVRLSGPTFNANRAAGNIDESTPILSQAIEVITRRVCEAEQEEIAETIVQPELLRLRQHWIDRALAPHTYLAYDEVKDGQTRSLLKQPEDGSEWEPFTCLNSLRNIEPTVHLILDANDAKRTSFKLDASDANIEDTETNDSNDKSINQVEVTVGMKQKKEANNA